MCLTNYGASEAVNLCSWYVENPPNIRNKNAPVILEKKISCSLTFVCASSFRPSNALQFEAYKLGFSWRRFMAVIEMNKTSKVHKWNSCRVLPLAEISAY